MRKRHNRTDTVSTIKGQGPVVVAPHAHQPGGPCVEVVEHVLGHPVAGVEHDVGPRHLGPHLRGQGTGTPRDVGVGDQEQAEGDVVGHGPPHRAANAPSQIASGRPTMNTATNPRTSHRPTGVARLTVTPTP